MSNTVIATEIARAQIEALQPKTSKTIMSSFDLVWGKSDLAQRLLDYFYLNESFVTVQKKKGYMLSVDKQTNGKIMFHNPLANSVCQPHG